MTVMVNRRERVRAATVQEIKDVARRQLVADGPGAVSLRAIAREMGMTAPALYRYFPSFDHLVQSMVSDLFDELCSVVADARDLASEDAGSRLVAACRAFRDWAVGHPGEFGLLFGRPLPGHGGDPSTGLASGGVRFGRTVLSSFAEVWQERPFPAPDDTALNAGLVDQLAACRDQLASGVPLGVLDVVLGCWMRLYGMVTLEVFDHMRFALSDPQPFFESQLAEVMARVGVVGVPTSMGR